MKTFVQLCCVAATLAAIAGSVKAQGFYGGVADGYRDAQERELQRRALELDARDGGNRAGQLGSQFQADRMRRQLEENNRLLRDMERDRLLYGR